MGKLFRLFATDRQPFFVCLQTIEELMKAIEMKAGTIDTFRTVWANLCALNNQTRKTLLTIAAILAAATVCGVALGRPIFAFTCAGIGLALIAIDETQKGGAL